MTDDEDLMASLDRLGASALRIKAERDELLKAARAASTVIHRNGLKLVRALSTEEGARLLAAQDGLLNAIAKADAP